MYTKTLAALTVAALLGLTGCPRNTRDDDGPLENAAEETEQTMEKAGEKTEEAAEEAGEEAEEAGEQMEDATDD